MLAIEASSVEELNSRISQLTRETLKCAASDHTCDNEVRERERDPAPFLHIQFSSLRRGHTNLLCIVTISISIPK
jgi:hypothetical protein